MDYIPDEKKKKKKKMVKKMKRKNQKPLGNFWVKINFFSAGKKKSGVMTKMHK